MSIPVFNTASDIFSYVAHSRAAGKTIGFVPTMGALHQGHATLIGQSAEENNITIASIFVNPQQFNDPADFDRYPQTFDQDLHLLEANGCSAVFHPASASEVYPEDAMRYLSFDAGQIGEVLEGKHRPGHFSGVASVLKRLFEIIPADVAYFGAKDYQQWLIVSKLVSDLHIPIRLVKVPTFRAASGLAMSSRNTFLRPEELQQAPRLHQVMHEAAEALAARTMLSVVRAEAIRELQRDNIFTLDYFDICSAETLQPLDQIHPHQDVIILVAAYLGKVRLIDNLSVRIE